MTDWPELDEAKRKKEDDYAQHLKKQRDEQEKATAEIIAKKRIKEEKIRILNKEWDGQIKDLLLKVAESTWGKKDKGWGWDITSENLWWRVGYEGSYYRVELITDKEITPMHFVIECGERQLQSDVSIEKLKDILVKAYKSGPYSTPEPYTRDPNTDWH